MYDVADVLLAGTAGFMLAVFLFAILSLMGDQFDG